jgi:PAS domain-containing protein
MHRTANPQSCCADETATGLAMFQVVGLIASILFLESDLNVKNKADFAARVGSRGAIVGILLLLGVLQYFTSRLKPRMGLRCRTMLIIALTACLHVRLYYEPEYILYVRGMGIWSVALKAALACFEIGFTRFLMFTAADSILDGSLQWYREASIDSPWRWSLICFLWFSIYGYTTERNARYSFVQRCDLYLERLVSEEAHRLHRFLTNNTKEMICVHDNSSTVIVGAPRIFARIKYVSHSCAQLTGWVTSELRNKSPLDFIHVSDQPLATVFFQCSNGASQESDSDERVAGTESLLPFNFAGSTNGSPHITPVVSLGFDDLASIEDITSKNTPTQAGQSKQVPAADIVRAMRTSRSSLQRYHSQSEDVAPQQLTDSPTDGSAGQMDRQRTSSPTAAAGRQTRNSASSLQRYVHTARQSRSSRTSIRLSRFEAESSDKGGQPPPERNLSAVETADGSVESAGRHSTASLEHVDFQEPDVVLVDVLPGSLPEKAHDSSVHGVLQRRGGNSSAAQRGIEVRFRHKDGGYIWVEISKNETSEGIVCVYRDASWKHIQGAA